jgi:hypothetical protein
MTTRLKAGDGDHREAASLAGLILDKITTTPKLPQQLGLPADGISADGSSAPARGPELAA